MSAIHPDVDLQASLLARKVLRGVMSLSAAVEELDEWQAETVADREAHIASRALIVTHALNTLIRRERPDTLDESDTKPAKPKAQSREAKPRAAKPRKVKVRRAVSSRA